MKQKTCVPVKETAAPLNKIATSPKKPSRRFGLRNPIGLGVLVLGLALIAGMTPLYLKASDHDDGEVDAKGRNLNLTDLFVFREKDQNPNASQNDLVLIMNTNPRSLARQQYYFSTRAKYEFKVSRVGNNDATPTGKEDVVLQFTFSPPDANRQQTITMTAIRDGAIVLQTKNLRTTPLNPNPSAPPIVNQVSGGGANLAVFAGLREDPFFFDVEQYFRVRAAFLGIGPAVSGFRPPEQAIDFTKGYNVNAIAVRVPIKFLQGSTSATTFDVWETISVPGANGKFTQFERLARPAINEGLVVTNDFLNALNTVSPGFEAAALAGQQPAANIAGPIVGEAKKTLLAFGNTEQRANALLGAFLPDVMRIDTRGPSGYANALNAKGSPIRGRLIKDDVIDITLSVVTEGKVTSDNVSYDGAPGNPAQGHKPLQPAFPYLALPN
ncbi:DUF4331 domain-containing protein [Coleofasciculus sp. FACHB-T130]|uniref:DUF4331 domain-containing protein n=2 Tax=Cyanobacteriota TaxID=1117 RepID=UPI001688EF8E|nr:DUF4331 domain-containing protein [Coleofasciculus sp. FACHB-T130]MBD1877308.1 DUF4331 domain-containing protein [Coleofasciculus sp. FACHB-T130]